MTDILKTKKRQGDNFCVIPKAARHDRKNTQLARANDASDTPIKNEMRPSVWIHRRLNRSYLISRKRTITIQISSLSVFLNPFGKI